MKKVIIIIAILVIIVLGVGSYFLFSQKSVPANGAPAGGQQGTLPAVATNSSTPSNLPDYVGQVSQLLENAPTSTYLSVGTAQGTVRVNNFYLSNPPVIEGGNIIIKRTSDYIISYDPNGGSFWLAIVRSPFAIWQNAAEQDFITTLGISKADACKLSVSSGVIYTPGNPNDGRSFPLSFCASAGAFQPQ